MLSATRTHLKLMAVTDRRRTGSEMCSVPDVPNLYLHSEADGVGQHGAVKGQDGHVQQGHERLLRVKVGVTGGQNKGRVHHQ